MNEREQIINFLLAAIDVKNAKIAELQKKLEEKNSPNPTQDSGSQPQA